MNKMKKKLLIIITALTMVLTMGSCGDQRLHEDEPETARQEAVETVRETPQPEAQAEAEEAPEEPPAEEPAPEPVQQQNITVEGNGYTVEVKSAKASSDYAGNPIVLVECVFTNSNPGPEAFGDVVGYTARQNGNRLVSEGENLILDMSILMPLRQEIGSGQSITVNVPFATGDYTTPIDLEINIFDASTTYASASGQIPIISA